MRKERFELSRSCERQPLKLVRLPVPPLSLREGTVRLKPDATLAGRYYSPAKAGRYFFSGSDGAGADGAGAAGAGALVVGAGPPTPRIRDPGP